MPIHLPGRRAAALTPALVAACLALAACGSSGGSSAGAARAPATGATGASGPGRFAAVRQCLARNGINLPQRPAGQRGPGGGIFGGGPGGPGAGGGGPRLPAGVTRQQLQAALAKCGAGTRAGGPGRFRNSPAFQRSLTAFAACMRKNGINLPAPNTTGPGPIFNTRGIDTTSPKFATASARCRAVLRGRFGGPAGSGGPPPGAPGAPGAAGGPVPSTQ